MAIEITNDYSAICDHCGEWYDSEFSSDDLFIVIAQLECAGRFCVMTIRLSHDIFCDKCGHWEGIFVRSSVAKMEARKMAKSWGWTQTQNVNGKRDLCPACSGNEILDTRLGTGSYKRRTTPA